MFVKNMHVALLLGFYRELLSDHDRGILESYFFDDLSLAEVADNVGISRQGVRHIIKKGEEQLLFWESKLHMAEREESLKAAAEPLQAMPARLREAGWQSEAQALEDCLTLILQDDD